MCVEVEMASPSAGLLWWRWNKRINDWIHLLISRNEILFSMFGHVCAKL